jgi:hypothetical protein
MNCLDYRCAPLLPQLLEVTRRHLASLCQNGLNGWDIVSEDSAEDERDQNDVSLYIPGH